MKILRLSIYCITIFAWAFIITTHASLPPTRTSSHSRQSYETPCLIDESYTWREIYKCVTDMREQEITKKKLSWPYPDSTTLDLRPSGHTWASLQKTVSVRHSTENENLWYRRYDRLEKETLASQCTILTSQDRTKTESENYLFEFLKNPKEIGSDDT